MKKIFGFIPLLVAVSLLTGGCTVKPQPLEKSESLPVATPEVESQLVPVKPIEQTDSTTSIEVTDEVLDSTDSMLDDLDQTTYSDLPASLGD